MASLNGKQDLPKASLKATTPGTAANATTGIKTNDAPPPIPVPRVMTPAGGFRTPANIKEIPAVRECLNKMAIEHPELAHATYEGFLYKERVKTFVDNKWPSWLWSDKGETSPANGGSASDPCTVHELAMAGFMYFPEDKMVTCFICHRGKSAEDFSSATDPWKVHEELFRDCPLLKQGKPSRPDDYKMRTILMLMGECEALRVEYEYLQLEKRTQEMMKDIEGDSDDDDGEEYVNAVGF